LLFNLSDLDDESFLNIKGKNGKLQHPVVMIKKISTKKNMVIFESLT
jgi:hypothetical protein